MAITVKEVHTYDFDDLMYNCWSGAIDTLKEIERHDKEEEFMDYIENVFFDEEIDLTDLNDFLWFDSDRIFEYLGIKYGIYEEDEEGDDE